MRQVWDTWMPYADDIERIHYRASVLGPVGRGFDLFGDESVLCIYTPAIPTAYSQPLVTREPTNRFKAVARAYIGAIMPSLPRRCLLMKITCAIRSFPATALTVACRQNHWSSYRLCGVMQNEGDAVLARPPRPLQVSSCDIGRCSICRKRLAVQGIVKLLSGALTMGAPSSLPAGRLDYPGAWRLLVFFIPAFVLGLSCLSQSPSCSKTPEHEGGRASEQRRVLMSLVAYFCRKLPAVRA